jgi:heme-degrading monooxygenase HmoA
VIERPSLNRAADAITGAASGALFACRSWCSIGLPASVRKGGRVMELDQSYVWITTRRLKPGTREEFSRAWRPRGFPEGMLRAYECYAVDGNEVVGISIWDSPQSREWFRLSEVEAERRQAMAPFVIEESSGFYVGRELKIPER